MVTTRLQNGYEQNAVTGFLLWHEGDFEEVGWGSHGEAAINEPNVTTWPTRRSRGRRRNLVGGLFAGRLTVAAVLALLLPACASHDSATRPLQALPRNVFLTVQYRSTDRALYLRSATDGRVVRVLLPMKYDEISAAMARDGSVLAAAQTGPCRVVLDRILPATLSRRQLRVIREPVFSLAVSPDGRNIGYLTTPTCSQSHAFGGAGRGIVAAPAAPAGFGPSVLVILNLTTGVRTATSVPRGFPLVSVAFSPDGRSVATTYRRDGTIRVMPVANPQIDRSRALQPPHGCGYINAIWTVAGIDAISGCGQELLLSPGPLVELTPTGRRLRSWTLPGCIDGTELATDYAKRQLLMQFSVGYGGDTCGQAPVQQIVEVTGRNLRPIIRTTGYEAQYSLTG